MPPHVATVARSELVRASVITRSHSTSVEASSRFSVHLSPAPKLRTTLRTTPEQTSAALQRSLVGHNDRAKRCKSAAAAEPIAFARTDIAEPEEEDFYSILGVVRFFLASFSCLLGACLQATLTFCCMHAVLQRKRSSNQEGILCNYARVSS